MTQTLSISEIMNMIPHRYPFLLVDKIIALTPSESIVGIKNVTMNEPQFTGHFPGNPVMPGVLMIEALAQVACVLAAKTINANPNEKEVYFMGIENAKFRRIVVPGDTLHLHAKITQHRGPVWKFAAHAEVDGELAVEAAFTAMVKDKS
jgi:3-hydroxyacyl-[acyl-carrier-protein] dehydratase